MVQQKEPLDFCMRLPVIVVLRYVYYCACACVYGFAYACVYYCARACVCLREYVHACVQKESHMHSEKLTTTQMPSYVQEL